jgi:hypothetical protein
MELGQGSDPKEQRVKNKSFVEEAEPFLISHEVPFHLQPRAVFGDFRGKANEPILRISVQREMAGCVFKFGSDVVSQFCQGDPIRVSGSRKLCQISCDNQTFENVSTLHLKRLHPFEAENIEATSGCYLIQSKKNS